jgi:hypothetical protein
MFAQPPLGGGGKVAAPPQQEIPKSRDRYSQFIQNVQNLKMSELRASQRDPVNIMSLQAPKDLKGPL